MKQQFSKDSFYAASEDVVARKIENEIILIPVDMDIRDKENQLYTLNSAAQVIWKRLNKGKSLRDIIADLTVEFSAPAKVIEKDVIALVKELLKRKLLVMVLNK
jgi:UDP-N-acetyl-D-mannosaminuronate dehydrogenase